MSKPTLILLSGWKQSGKDTAADFLVNNYSAKRLGFADPLKQLTAELTGLSLDHFYVNKMKEVALDKYPVTPKDAFSAMVTNFMAKELKDGKWTPRALLILIGSVMRSVDPNYWVKKAVAQVTNPTELYVIADCRYKNEIETIKALDIANVLTVRVNRFDSSPSNDPSERDLDDYQFDVVLENKGTLEQFYCSIEQKILGASDEQ